MMAVPVARPRMPRAEALLPYLKRIDDCRTYSNFGPLVSELEARLAQRLHVDPACVVTVANATSGLTLALQTIVGEPGGFCLIPSWTFVATAHAVSAAGLTPFLVDVDEGSWALTPDIARAALAKVAGHVAAVMPVAPFGAPMDIDAWDRFTEETGIPVVVDAAAGHDGVRVGHSPAVVSLHATKILGAGEGGYVVCRDRLARRQWVGFQVGFGSEWCGSVCVARFVGADQQRIIARLDAIGVGNRAWWGAGVHAQTAFSELPRLPLPVTEMLAEETLGLPYFVDMTDTDVERVCRVIEYAH